MESIYSGGVRGGLAAEQIRRQRLQDQLTLEDRALAQQAQRQAIVKAERDRMAGLQAAQYDMHNKQLAMQEQKKKEAMGLQQAAALKAIEDAKALEAMQYERSLKAQQEARANQQLSLNEQAAKRADEKQKWDMANPKATSLELMAASSTAPGLQTEIPAVNSQGEPIAGKKTVTVLSPLQQKAILEAGRKGMSLADAAKAAGARIEDVPGLAVKEYQKAIDAENDRTYPPVAGLGIYGKEQARLAKNQASLEEQRQKFKATMKSARDMNPKDLYWDGSKWVNKSLSLDATAKGAQSPAVDAGAPQSLSKKFAVKDPVEGDTATDKRTGQKIVLRNGKWEPLP